MNEFGRRLELLGASCTENSRFSTSPKIAFLNYSMDIHPCKSNSGKVDIETFRSHCIQKPGFSEDFPFDSTTLAFRVGGKIFALMDVDAFEFVNLKCNPEKAVELREAYSGILPGYHMNKANWNSVYTKKDVPSKLFIELADHSYELVRDSLPASQRKILS